ncbi:MAG: alkaline phosphatase family protein, partial [Myxococcales bacterium]|nr:alkaline phosphatase family protein [Myxococcales bacterium]
PARYARSTYSAAVTRGAQLHPYVSFPEALVHLGELIARADGPAYHAVYLDVVDALSHRHGPSSPHVDAELRSLFAALADELPRVLGARGRRTLALLTADHGQIAVDPARTVYVDDRVPALSRWLRRASDGRPLVPGGSPRDLFLYVQPGRVDEARSALERALADCATVHASAELFEAGVFGPSPSPRLRARVGDLLILPRANEMVFWRGDGRFVQSKRGHHGGMSAEEMEIPLLAWRPGA